MSRTQENVMQQVLLKKKAAENWKKREEMEMRLICPFEVYDEGYFRDLEAEKELEILLTPAVYGGEVEDLIPAYEACTTVEEQESLIYDWLLFLKKKYN